MNRNKELFKENLDNLEKALEKSIRKNTPPPGDTKWHGWSAEDLGRLEDAGP